MPKALLICAALTLAANAPASASATVSGISKVSPLKQTSETPAVTRIPGMNTYENVTLKRGTIGAAPAAQGAGLPLKRVFGSEIQYHPTRSVTGFVEHALGGGTAWPVFGDDAGSARGRTTTPNQQGRPITDSDWNSSPSKGSTTIFGDGKPGLRP